MGDFLPEATDIGALLDPVNQNGSIAGAADHQVKCSREGQACDGCFMAEQDVHAAEELEAVGVQGGIGRVGSREVGIKRLVPGGS